MTNLGVTFKKKKIQEFIPSDRTIAPHYFLFQTVNYINTSFTSL